MKKEVYKNGMRRLNRISYISILIFLALLSQNNAQPLKAGEGPKVIFSCFANTFDFNATKPNDYACLQQVASKLKEYPDYWGIIDGHRDRIEDSGTSLARANNARAKEACCLLELPSAAFLEIYNGDSGTTVSLQHAIHRSLMRSLARTNTRLARLIAHHKLEEAGRDVEHLEVAIRAQMWQPL